MDKTFDATLLATKGVMETATKKGEKKEKMLRIKSGKPEN